MFGKVELTRDEYIDLTTLAKEGIVSRAKILDLQQSLSQVTVLCGGIKNRCKQYRNRQSYILRR